MLLIVEDDEFVLGQLCRVARQSCQVQAATDTREAIGVIDRELPLDGAVVGVGLPSGSGFEVVDHLRSTGQRLPVLVLTGRNDHETISRAQMLGATYLLKPFASENLEAFMSLVTATRSIASSIAPLGRIGSRSARRRCSGWSRRERRGAQWRMPWA